MNNLLTYIRNHHADILRYLLVFISVVLIVAVLPKERRFKYEFEKGKPWLHENLLAPFDFAINKSKEQLEKERQDVVSHFIPYYRVNISVREEKIEFLKNELSEEKKLNNFQLSKKKKRKLLEEVLPVIENIYKNGVILLHEDHDNKPKNLKVNVLINNISQEKLLKDFFSIKQALNLIYESLEISSEDLSSIRPLFENAIAHNILFDEATNKKFLEQHLGNIALNSGMIQKGEMVITKGSIVDDFKYQVLSSLKTEYQHEYGAIGNYYYIAGGQFLMICIAFVLLVTFLYVFRKDVLLSTRKLALILLLVTITILLVAWGLKSGFTSMYILPYCLVPIIIRILMDIRLALFVHIITILLAGLFIPNSFEFVFIECFAGMAAIFSIVNLRKRSQFFVSCALILLTYILTYLGMSVVKEGNFDNIIWMNFNWFLISVLLTLLAYPLIYAFEKIFGFTSEITLLELADTNNPLLKELSLVAPGTFQHSLQVANLAEAVVFETGGNSTLVRTGALYHDIGKMDNNTYFIENQNTGINPHDELPPEESAGIIIGHVIKGIEKAKKHKLPDTIADFIRTHHGTTRVEYFYHEFLKESNNEEAESFEFNYPGPLPFSKETAVLMMSDAVEAASRSLKDPTEDSINDLVDQIIDNQIDQDQFINSNITFKDIKVAKRIFKKMLQSIYHVRMEYPK